MQLAWGLTFFATAPWISGCATIGESFPTQNVERIVLDETTRSDIKTMFGEPWRTGIDNGQRTWTYAKYRWSAFNATETTDLVIRFNEDGTVDSYVYNTTED